MSRGIVFIGLNAVRALSLLTLILVFASNIMQMVHDIRAVNRFMATQGEFTPSDDNSTSIDVTTMTDYDYIAGSTVPNQAAGVFWAVLNRLLILGECIFLILAEIGFPERFFVRFFPVLGPDFGVGALGIFQCLIGASVLSHHIEEFALVSAFFLFSVGCVNMLVGLIFREKGKAKRSFNPAQSENPALSQIKQVSNLKPIHLGGTTFPHGFTNVTGDVASQSQYSIHSSASSITEKTPAPAYGYQASTAFGRAAGGEKGGAALLDRPIAISQPEQAHPNMRPTVFQGAARSAGRSPSFESSPGSAV